MFTLSELEAAADLVHRVIPPTPQYNWPLLSERAGCELWIKHENHTPIGAFKLRGGLVYMDELGKSGESISGIITATRGNHGQSLAFAGREYGRSVTILVPRGNSVEKNEAMRGLGDRCGPLVLQFPYFNKQAFSGPAPFLKRLDAYLETLPDEFRYAVEIRNRWWIKPPLLEILRRHRTALVLVELSYLPHPVDLAQSLDLVTTDFVYARLIGDRKAVEEKTKKFDRLVLDQSESLARWAELLRELKDRVPDAYVFANNHYRGQGVVNALELKAMLTERPVDVPSELLAAYPRLREIATPAPPTSLFD